MTKAIEQLPRLVTVRLTIPRIDLRRLEPTCSPLALVISACAAIGLRLLLEQLAYQAPTTDPWFILGHVPASYFGMALALSAFAALLSGWPLARALRLVMACMPVILAVPLIDLAVYGIRGRQILYLNQPGDPVGQLLGALFLRKFPGHISIGQFLIVHLIAITMTAFVWIASRQAIRAVLGWASACIVPFAFFAWPFAARHTSLHVCNFLRLLAGMPELHMESGQVGMIPDSQAQLAAIFLILIPLAAVSSGMLWDRDRFLVLLRSAEPCRLLHYVLIAALGIIVGTKQLGALETIVGDPFNPLALACFFLGIAMAFVGAVFINDYYDRDIDRLSNPWRAVARGTIQPARALMLAAAAQTGALLCAAALGSHVFLLFLCFIGLSVLYSAPPLRLRRFFPAGLLIIGLINALVFQAGYALVAGRADAPPPARTIVGLALGVSLIASFKDLKDAAGDRAYRISTLMTLLRAPWGQRATAASIFLGANCIAWSMVPGTWAWILGLFSGAAGAWIVQQGKGRERPLFVLYFAAMLLVTVVYVALPSPGSS